MRKFYIIVVDIKFGYKKSR